MENRQVSLDLARFSQLTKMFAPKIDLTSIIEIGEIVITNSSWTFSDGVNNKIRTKHSIYLRTGDTIGLYSYGNAKIYVGYKTKDGIYGSSEGWIKEDYTIVIEGDYVFSVQYDDGSTVSIDGLGSLIFVRANTVLPDNGIEEDVAKRNSAALTTGNAVLQTIDSYYNESDEIDYAVCDEYYNAVLAVKGGHIKTKNFDSEKSLPNPFYSLKMVGIGDSIMHGQSMQVGPSRPYMQLICSTLRMTYKNYGLGGSTIAESSLIIANVSRPFGGIVASTSEMTDTSKYYVILNGGPSTSGVGTYSGTTYYHNGTSWTTSDISARPPLTARYQLMDDDADIILVAAGTNDFQYNWTSVGTIEDAKASSPTPDTFYGAVAYLCKGLIDKYPSKLIVFCTPIKRGQTQTATSDTVEHRGGSYGTQDSKNAKNKTLKDYCDIIKEVCERYSIPVLDMYSECGLSPFVQSNYFDNYYTHPNQTGHNIMARYLIGKLKALFGKNS